MTMSKPKMVRAVNSMQTNQIMLMANVNRSQIEVTKTHYNIKSIPITVDNAIMNDVLYPANENKLGMNSMVGNPVTLGHPVVDGQNASGRSGGGLDDHYSGGTIKSVYNSSGVWYANASIKKSILNAQDGGSEYATMLDNKEDIGVSTGLMFEDNEMSGVNDKGKPYSKTAINQQYDHLAFLANEQPAGGQDTVMRFNVADVMPQEGWASKAWNAVKSVFKSNEDSFDQIRDKIYRKLNEGLSNDVCGRYPHDVWADHFVYRSENDKLYKQSYALIDDEVTFVGEPIEVERVIEYETVTNQDGENVMLEKIKAKLTAANVKTDGLDEDGVLAAYNELLLKPVEGSTPTGITLEDVTKAVNAAIKPLETQLAANHNVELDGLKTQMKAMTTNKLSDSVIDKMDSQEMKDHLAANGQVGFNVQGGQHVNVANSDEQGFGGMEMPNIKES